MSKRIVFTFLGCVLILALIAGCAPGGAAPAGKEPVVIGYIGQVSSSAIKPAMDAMKWAIDEVNAAGGLLGRPIRFVTEDSKGETSLAVAAATRMVLGHKALVYYVEGRTEINLAIMPKSAALYKQQPHIMVAQAPMGREITLPVVEQYDTYKFVFRDYVPEDAFYCDTVFPTYFTFWKEVMGVKKMAWLWEDLAWTMAWRNGLPDKGLPKLEDYAKEYGIETVYSKPVRPRAGSYLPILEAIAGTGADLIFFVSSWFTDTDVFVKQWCESSAKDIPVCLFGGLSQGPYFWQITGGKALGVVTSYYEAEVPYGPDFVAWIKECRKRGLPVQGNVGLAYGDIWFLWEVVNKAQSLDPEKLIPVYETMVLTEENRRYGQNTKVGGYALSNMAGQCSIKVAPFFHSGILADPNNPKKTHPLYEQRKWVDRWTIIAQFQGADNIPILATGNGTPPPSYRGNYAEPQKYKPPAQLRKEAGWR